MDFDIVWLVPDRVLCWRTPREITIDMLKQIHAETRPIALNGIPPVHFVLDTLATQRYPSIADLSLYRFPEVSADFGWNVLIVISAALRHLLSIILRLSKGRYRVVATMQDAMVFLKQSDPTLVLPTA